MVDFNLPVKAEHGLLGSSVTVHNSATGEWGRDVTYPVLGHQFEAINISQTGDKPNSPVASSEGEFGSRNQEKFLVSVKTKYSTMGAPDYKEYIRQMSESVEGLIQTALEKEFSEALVSADSNRSLAKATTVVTPTDLKGGLGALEQEYTKRYGVQPTLHIPSSMVMDNSSLKPDKKDVLRTRLGSPVVAGAGYASVYTADSLSGSVYATGPITVVIPRITEENAVNRYSDAKTNTAFVDWEVAVAVVWTTEGVLKTKLTKTY